MSDPSWASRVLPQADEGIIYVQAGGTVTAAGADDELAFCSEVSIDIKGERKKKGPWINYSKQKTASGGVGFSGKTSIDWTKAADAVRSLIITAALNQTRIKVTFESYASGDKWVLDQALVDASMALKAADGMTGEFSFDADTCTYTAATA